MKLNSQIIEEMRIDYPKIAEEFYTVRHEEFKKILIKYKEIWDKYK